MANTYPMYMKDGDMIPDEAVSSVTNVRKETDHARNIFRYAVEFAGELCHRNEPKEKMLLDACRNHIHRHNEILAANCRGLAELERWLKEAEGNTALEDRIRLLMDAFTVVRT